MTLREAHTAIISQGDLWAGNVATEPFEAPWAAEVVVFLRLLDGTTAPTGIEVRLQISPDGMHWVDEGTRMALPAAGDEVTFARLAHFGQYIRLAATLPADSTCRVLATLSLKS